MRTLLACVLVAGSAVAAGAQPSIDAVRATVPLNNDNAIGAQGIALDPVSGFVYIAINGAIVSGCDGDSSRPGSKPFARKGDNRLVLINPAEAREVAVVPTGSGPVWPTVDPIRRVVFVANSGSGTVTIHDAATGAMAGAITTGGKPHMGGLDLASRLMVVGNTVRSSEVITEQNHASVVDTAGNRVVREFETGQAPHGVVVDQERHLAYSTSVGDGLIAVVNTETGQDLFSSVPKARFGASFGNNNMIARQASSRRLFQVNSQPNATGVIVVDEVTLAVDGLIEFARNRPWGLWVDEPNRLLFAALPNANAIGVADLDTLTHVASIPVGTCPYAVTIDPERRVGVASNTGSPTVNASASIFDLCPVYAATGRTVAACR